MTHMDYQYLMLLMVFSTSFSTLSGSGAYRRAPAIFCPFFMLQLRNSTSFFPFDRVFLLLIHQEPGEAGDGVGVLARLVDQGNAVIGRHVLYRAGCCGAGRFYGRLDKLPVLVLDEGIGKLVFKGVGEFHVADGVAGGLDLAGHPFVTLAAETYRPLDRRSLADLAASTPHSRRRGNR